MVSPGVARLTPPLTSLLSSMPDAGVNYQQIPVNCPFATKVNTFGEGAIFIGAVFAGVGAIYGAKAWEAVQSGKQAATVEVAKVNSSTTTP